jgi:hypothetical protein
MRSAEPRSRAPHGLQSTQRYRKRRRDVGLYQLRQCNIWCGGEVTTGDAFTLWHPAGDYFHASNARELAAYARARALELLTIAATLEAEEVTA